MSDNWEWKTDKKEEGTVVEEANKPDPNLVSIVIPVYLHDYSLFHYTGNCIGSIREHTPIGSYELIIVDNGSPIKHKEMADWKVDKVITNEKNMGVAYAWNQGIRAARGGYICLLNNDTMVFNHWLETLLQSLELGLDFVMATPMYGDAFARAVESNVKFVEWDGKDLKDSFSDFRDFACVLAKKSLFDDIGLFDEQFGLGYGEDLDFFKRLDKEGKKYASTKKVGILHIIGATSHGMPEIPGIMDKNRELLKQKWEGKKEETKSEVKTDEPKVWGEDVPPASSQVSENPSKPSPLVRTPVAGDKVFLVDGNKACWVTSPEILVALGFGFGDVRVVSNEEFYKLQYGDQITMENVGKYAQV